MSALASSPVGCMHTPAGLHPGHRPPLACAHAAPGKGGVDEAGGAGLAAAALHARAARPAKIGRKVVEDTFHGGQGAGVARAGAADARPQPTGKAPGDGEQVARVGGLRRAGGAGEVLGRDRLGGRRRERGARRPQRHTLPPARQLVHGTRTLACARKASRFTTTTLISRAATAAFSAGVSRLPQWRGCCHQAWLRSSRGKWLQQAAGGMGASAHQGAQREPACCGGRRLRRRRRWHQVCWLEMAAGHLLRLVSALLWGMTSALPREAACRAAASLEQWGRPQGSRGQDCGLAGSGGRGGVGPAPRRQPCGGARSCGAAWALTAPAARVPAAGQRAAADRPLTGKAQLADDLDKMANGRLGVGALEGGEGGIGRARVACGGRCGGSGGRGGPWAGDGARRLLLAGQPPAGQLHPERPRLPAKAGRPRAV